ncbi:MAG: hypothetical protein KJ600_00515 [Nanoarchaeota archaeon]|nr:hypothetical protein [Nanoarchaeota archaeon]MBU1103026.1 hypothetical protein [Nanoarchaeota archaeon]
MALNISILLLPWPIFLTVLILIVSAIIVLTLVKRKLDGEVILKREEEETYFQRKLQSVLALRENPSKFLIAIDDVAREFFGDKFDISGVRYSDILEQMKQEDNGAAVKFCEVMQEVLYSGTELRRERIDFLFEKLQYLFRETQKERIMQIKNEPQHFKLLEGEAKLGEKIKVESLVGTGKEKLVGSGKIAPVKEEKTLPELPKLEEKEVSVVVEEIPQVKVEEVREEVPVVEVEVQEVMAEEPQVVGEIKVQEDFRPRLVKPIAKKGLFGEFLDLFKKEEKPGRSLAVQRPAEKVKMNLVKYFSEGKKRGLDMTVLEEKLISRGFDRLHIDDAIANVRQEEEVPEKQKEMAQKKEEVTKPLPEDGGKKIMDKFFHPKNLDLDNIKREVGTLKSGKSKLEKIPRAKPIEVIPYKKEKIKVKEKSYPEKEPESYHNIENMDSLERLKEKLRKREGELGWN